MTELELLSVVALTEELPEKRLQRGQVGRSSKILRREYTKSSLVTIKAERMRLLPKLATSLCVYTTSRPSTPLKIR
jgi:hypothetical protein